MKVCKEKGTEQYYYYSRILNKYFVYLEPGDYKRCVLMRSKENFFKEFEIQKKERSKYIISIEIKKG